MQVVPEDELSLQLSDSFLLGMLRQSQPPSVSLWQCNYLRAPPALSHICIYSYFYRWSVASVSAQNYIVVILFFLFIEPSPSQELRRIAYDKKYMFQRLISDNGRAWHPGVSFTSVVDHSFLELDSTPSIEEQPQPSPSQSNQPGRLHSCKETEMTNCLTSDPLPQP